MNLIQAYFFQVEASVIFVGIFILVGLISNPINTFSENLSLVIPKYGTTFKD